MSPKVRRAINSAFDAVIGVSMAFTLLGLFFIFFYSAMRALTQ